VRALWVFLLCVVATSAFGAERALVRADKLFEALEFDAAAAAYADALREPGTREERLRAWKGLALSEAFMGQAKQAQAHFETLLSIEPDVEVSRALGPKIRKPYEAARKKMKGQQRGVLKVERRQDGRVEVALEHPPAVATELAVYVRHPGEPGFKVTEGAVPGPVLAPAAAVRAVEVYAEAKDAADGVLVERGSAQAPLRFEATEEPPPAVVAAEEPPREEVSVERSRPVWPWVAGGVGVVAAGVVAGIFLSQPAELKLPPAQRTERLP
jgi:tetratricopeptide (TPR) repeat protein